MDIVPILTVLNTNDNTKIVSINNAQALHSAW
jgi:hypothetical protein